ncbi:hypothetical protein HELRODRAFT_97768 [Helobdella robusta]|uniref:NF-X1-type domain-containing protein n=1 Tax=Helobdella robusta TaxID=6412 RepID=T1G9I9_HELRO|nr:hypothetical protein HELRODRAFT_97768 [Helobdella robusta]ESO08824.1 hypothetical protein HELRODRAFT_97768 [Helobdella robusta]
MDDRPAYLRGKGRGLPNSHTSNNPNYPNNHNTNWPTNPNQPSINNSCAGRGKQYHRNSKPANSTLTIATKINTNIDMSAKSGNIKKPIPNSTFSDVSSPNNNNKCESIDSNNNDNNCNNNNNNIEVFNAAMARHKKAAEKHLNLKSSLLSDDDDDDEDDYNEIKKRDAVFNNMLGTLNKGSSDLISRTDLGRTGDCINETLKSKANICLICIETVKKVDPIWNCSGCYTMFHIQCIQMWIRDGAYQTSSSAAATAAVATAAAAATAVTSSLSSTLFHNKDHPWFCPKCRCSYSQLEFPSVYFCFCGKADNPSFDVWLVPHSCGQVCRRKLKPECGHVCLLLCHPGPCPPCPQTVRTRCYCGKADPQLRRCGLSSMWSCGDLCGRQLSCGYHKCPNVCHKGSCQECTKQSLHKCQCGREELVVPCSSRVWQCQQVCEKSLSCGHHDCSLVCHSGPCPPCPKSGSRSCPCGKTKFDLPCTDDAPTCLETCGKVLECGTHTCVERCHQGPCGMCRELVKKRCRCGKKEKVVHCHKEYQCDTKCTNMKNCAVHQCKRKCCDGACPPCTAICGKMLACRQHKCNSTCHRGQCYPCCLMETLQCNCGATKKSVPCGAARHTKPPRCRQFCKTPPDCHHPSRLPHPCHFGQCPRCTQTCSKLLSCSHCCPAVCHSAVEVKNKDSQQLSIAGPWEINLIKDKIEVVSRECPPCLVPVSVTCFGGHETIMVQCCDVRQSSCHRPCSRLLPCTNHSCTISCHVVVGGEIREGDGVLLAGSNCETCDKPCAKLRHADCTHVCPLPCHSSDCPPCTQMVRMRCHCQMMVKHVPCHQWCIAGDLGGSCGENCGDRSGGVVSERNALKSCGSRCPKMLPCTHQCKSICHPGNCPPDSDCLEKVKVRCSCGRRKVEFECRELQRGGAKVDCNQSCQAEKERIKKENEEEDRRRAKLEAEKYKEEIERFDKRLKGEGQKRKRRNLSAKEDEERSFFSKFQKYILLSGLVVVFAVCFYWLTFQ